MVSLGRSQYNSGHAVLFFTILNILRNQYASGQAVQFPVQMRGKSKKKYIHIYIFVALLSPYIDFMEGDCNC